VIRHTVSFALVHPPESAGEQAFLARAGSVLSAIPGVQDFTISRQVSPKSRHRFQFAMSFADEDAYASYDAHPDHREFVATSWDVEVADFQELDLVPITDA
jgi:hypothetical protein